MLTKPEMMRVWWGAEAEIEVDLRVGGRWAITRWDGDVEYHATGDFLELDWPSFLSFTFSMPRFSMASDTIAITIAEEGDGTTVVFEHTGEGIASELRELAPREVSVSETGWHQAFDLMAAAWAEST